MSTRTSSSAAREGGRRGRRQRVRRQHLYQQPSGPPAAAVPKSQEPFFCSAQRVAAVQSGAGGHRPVLREPRAYAAFVFAFRVSFACRPNFLLRAKPKLLIDRLVVVRSRVFAFKEPEDLAFEDLESALMISKLRVARVGGRCTERGHHESEECHLVKHRRVLPWERLQCVSRYRDVSKADGVLA